MGRRGRGPDAPPKGLRYSMVKELKTEERGTKNPKPKWMTKQTKPSFREQVHV